MNPDNQTPREKTSYFVQNWLSVTGAIIALGSIFSFITLFALDFFAGGENPYVGILTWIIAPGFFFTGTALIVLGRVLLKRELSHAAGRPFRPRFVFDFAAPKNRRALVVFGVCGLAFLLVSAVGGYQSYHATSSRQFCGQACHEPMGPQWTAYQDSPHAKVECTACHIGSGAANLVKAKFNGIHQLFSTFADSYARPITRPGVVPINQKTCEQCHWPERFVSNLEKTYHHFLADETNTPFSVRLILKVGGGSADHGPANGIHWHMNLANKIEYISTDEDHQTIPWVRITDSQGKITEYKTPEFKKDVASQTLHRMDCMTCHNRPAHQFHSPNDAVDQALALGQISLKLPAIKKEAVKALLTPAKTTTEAMGNIAASMRSSYPDHADRETAVKTLQAIYRRNFFPEMKTDWRVHPNNIGHKDWPGCFRCHDGSHKSSDGTKSIAASDCNACHTILAQGAGADLEKLNAKGHNFFHVDAEYSDFNCISCHTGAFPKE